MLSDLGISGGEKPKKAGHGREFAHLASKTLTQTRISNEKQKG
jgi:hypothetical protein